MITIPVLTKEQKKWSIAIGALVVSAFLALGSVLHQKPEQMIVGSSGLADSGQWFMFDSFSGYKTKADPQKIDKGANPIGQNTFINDGDKISVRDLGYELYPSSATRSATTTPITSMHTFRKRDGTNILMITDGNQLEYKHPLVGDFEILKSGYTTSTFGFADHNTNTDQSSYVYFSNAIEDYSRWTGNVTVSTSSIAIGGTQVDVADTTGFPATGTIVFCGVEQAYNGKTIAAFTLTAPSTVGCASGRAVAQAVETFPAAPKGNILMVMDTRMFVAGVASSTQALFYSKIANATDFTFSSPRVATDGGVINMPEGGGGITGMAIDEQVLYVFKRNIIKSVTFTQDSDDLPITKPVKPHDSKSQTVGAVSPRSVFTGGNGVFFITPNNEIMSLSRIASVDYPQTIPLSDEIKPTAANISWDDSTGVYWKNKAYFAGKSSVSSTINDVLLVYNFSRNAWESPVFGLNVGDFSIANFDGTDNLYFGDGATRNVYLITDTPLDDVYSVTANWRSREETFGAPHVLKSIDSMYVEGYIADNTTLTISLLLDEDGYTQIYTTNFEATENDNQYRFLSSVFNLFGFHPFGYERFGSNDDLSGKKKFRIYLSKSLRRISFYSAQVEFASDGDNQQWEILQYGMHVIPEPSQYLAKLLRVFQ